MTRDFEISHFLNKKGTKKLPEVRSKVTSKSELSSFTTLCSDIKAILDGMAEEQLDKEVALERQRNALIGEEKQVLYYKNKIKDILVQKNLKDEWYPEWYASLEDAIFSENLGFASIDNWIRGDTNELKESSSCKIIGDRIYYLINGETMLQPQTITLKRREQLKEALLLPTPEKDRSLPYHEVYLNNGIRATIYNDNGMTKKGQDCIVLRKYAVNTYTFEEQASKHTIPVEAIDLFKSMVKVGFNIAFTGPVRSAKTTFLTTYQCYENPKYEGLLIEKDPENPYHLILPFSPIMQLNPYDEYMDIVISTAKRSDAKYVVIGEARDGQLLNIAVEAANMGTRRSKMTFHNSDTIDFCYDVADKITKEYGGSLAACMIKVAKSFHYIANFVELSKDQSQKRLKGLWEVRFDKNTLKTTYHQICKYRFLTDDWVWASDIGQDKREIGEEEDWQAFLEFEENLAKIATKYPNHDNHVFQSPYDILILGGGNVNV